MRGKEENGNEDICDADMMVGYHCFSVVYNMRLLLVLIPYYLDYFSLPPSPQSPNQFPTVWFYATLEFGLSVWETDNIQLHFILWKLLFYFIIFY